MTAAAYARNGQPVSAETFYAIACDPRRSVAVEACAGAGKTWMLVSRIVRALLDGANAPETGRNKLDDDAVGEGDAVLVGAADLAFGGDADDCAGRREVAHGGGAPSG